MRIEDMRKFEKELIELRRHFHMYPELGFREHKTAKFVEDYLKDLGIETRRMAKTGVVGEIDNGGDKRIAIRADMDALPITEENDVPYKSRNHGVMHACGHDAHTAMLLITAKILSSMDFKGKVRFIFQPAEEGLNGAARMIRDGAINGVDAIFGLHVWSNLEAKKIAISPGPIMANVDQFRIEVIGDGGHGASPHQTHDPVVASAAIINSLQTVVSRNVDPLKEAVVTVGKIEGGTAFHIIPSRVGMEGTVRTFEGEIHDLVETRVKEIARNIARAYGCRARIIYKRLNFATVNDEFLAREAKKIASKITEVVDQERNMGGEDFSEYARIIPGLFAFLGIRNEKRGFVMPHHHPKFDMDESALIYGVAFEVKFALHLLNVL